MAFEIPFWEKYTLTVQEAAAYFRIGEKSCEKLFLRTLMPILSSGITVGPKSNARNLKTTLTGSTSSKFYLRKRTRCGIIQIPHRVLSSDQKGGYNV